MSETNWRLALLPVKKSVLVFDWEQRKIVQSWNESIFDALLQILWGHPLPFQLCKSASDVNMVAIVKIEKGWTNLIVPNSSETKKPIVG